VRLPRHSNSSSVPAGTARRTAVYNTTDLNNKANPKDTCPANLWAKVDPEALKKQYDVLGVFKNGPRGWLYDWYALPVGVERSFFGLQALWYMQIELPKDIKLGEKGSSAYKPATGLRASTQGYAKGKPVFILDDPSGTPWIMQAYSQIVDPNLTYDDLNTLDKKLKLAPGWKYRVKVLDQDLGIGAIDGKARVVRDDLENTYNACFEEGGKTNCMGAPASEAMNCVMAARLRPEHSLSPWGEGKGEGTQEREDKKLSRDFGYTTLGG
jgi:hypothetical protein